VPVAIRIAAFVALAACASEREARPVTAIDAASGPPATRHVAFRATAGCVGAKLAVGDDTFIEMPPVGIVQSVVLPIGEQIELRSRRTPRRVVQRVAVTFALDTVRVTPGKNGQCVLVPVER
jgi:hypothetical protein